MSDTCETVTIETEAGPVLINESDYDKKVHTLYVEKPAADVVKAPTKKADLHAALTELNVAFEESDTNAVLTEKWNAAQPASE